MNSEMSQYHAEGMSGHGVWDHVQVWPRQPRGERGRKGGGEWKPEGTNAAGLPDGGPPLRRLQRRVVAAGTR